MCFFLNTARQNQIWELLICSLFELWNVGLLIGRSAVKGAALTGSGSRPSPPPAGCARIEAGGRSEVCLLPPNSWYLQDTNQRGFYHFYPYCDVTVVIIIYGETTGSENSGKLNWESWWGKGKYWLYGRRSCLATAYLNYASQAFTLLQQKHVEPSDKRFSLVTSHRKCG